MSDQTLFDKIGGEAGVRALVEAFYRIMDTAPEAAGIRAIHPPDLSGSIDKLHWFLVGWMGGPPLYVQRLGHPRLRARHLPFAIGDDEAAQWMWCMNQAVEEREVPPLLRSTLIGALGRIAGHMRNQ